MLKRLFLAGAPFLALAFSFFAHPALAADSVAWNNPLPNGISATTTQILGNFNRQSSFQHFATLEVHSDTDATLRGLTFLLDAHAETGGFAYGYFCDYQAGGSAGFLGSGCGTILSGMGSPTDARLSSDVGPQPYPMALDTPIHVIANHDYAIVLFNGDDGCGIFTFPFCSMKIYTYGNPDGSTICPEASCGTSAVFSPHFGDHNPVLIVPGTVGTNLYDGSNVDPNNQVWINPMKLVSGIINGDVFLTQSLDLDSSGNSIKSIVTGDILRQIGSLNVFQGLINDLTSPDNGYQEGQDLFVFSYDWRFDIDITKDQLKTRIDEIKQQTLSSKIDIVAHSMGGLVTEDYINRYGKDSIKKIIFVATPHLGAPKAAKTLLAGDNLDNLLISPSAIKEIAHNAPSIYELLPNHGYFSAAPGYIKEFLLNTFPSTQVLDYNATKQFLSSQGVNTDILNGKVANFFSKNLELSGYSGIDTYNIAGCGEDTQTSYNLALLGGISRPEYGAGDGTVPLGSADFLNIPASHKFYVNGATHAALPSADGARQMIVNLLTGESNATGNHLQFEVSNSFCGTHGKQEWWKSPVEVQIYDSQGRHTGPVGNAGVIEYGIPGVQYDVIGHEKFIYLPEEEGQTYTTQAVGTATGTFDLQVSTNDSGTTMGAIIFNDVPVTTATHVSFAVSATTTDDVIMVGSGSDTPIVVHADATLAGDQTQDISPPVTTAVVSGTLGLSGFYRSDVGVMLSATDADSGVLVTKYSLDGGVTFLPYSGPVMLTQSGSNTMQFFSIDRAGNDEATQTIQVMIDKTPPDTLIDSGPADVTASTSATFSFHGTEAGVSFICKLDAATSTPCTSPKSYSALMPGTHLFSVYSTDAAGNADLSPATWSWTVTNPDLDGDGIPDVSDDCPTLSGTASFRGCTSGVEIRVFERQRVGAGNHPSVVTEPVAGALLRVFDTRAGSCAAALGVNPQTYGAIFNTCTPIAHKVTDANGDTTIGLKPGIEWLIVGHDPVTDVYTKKLVKTQPGQSLIKKMHVIVTHDGHATPADDDEDHGSILYTIRPEEVVWDSNAEPYPYVFESEGNWDVTVNITPPEGFVSDVSSLSTSVDNQTQALQFNLTDTGSCWECGTKTHLTLHHEGRTVTHDQLTPTPMTEHFMYRKGLKPDDLKRRGARVIKSVESR